MSETTKMKVACGQIGSGFCPWKILVHRQLELENWPVIDYLSRVPQETDNEIAGEKDQVNLIRLYLNVHLLGELVETGRESQGLY